MLYNDVEKKFPVSGNDNCNDDDNCKVYVENNTNNKKM